MALRMNLQGWSLEGFKQTIGSKDSALLEKAEALISDALTSEPAHSKAQAWLRRLVMDGFPLRQDREAPSVPDDGRLLTVQMETEPHIVTMCCLAHAIARDDHLDLTIESSHCPYGAIGELYRELAECGFSKTKQCGIPYFTWMNGLIQGTPMFGDAFRTDWSFYTFFSNDDLAAMIPVFQRGAEFRRALPEGYPDELAKKMVIGLTDSGRTLILELIKWFGQIQQDGQDALIVWD
ncbi:hypothetical protein [Singulisphaera sp. PoT]|uniref:hypothetical protein n=1 Tax=Singulisphaera sp. PoT TaxID=3411797 RepID=UPI003BF5BA70